MKHMSCIRRAVLAGALALSAAGAGVGGAEAMPIAAPLAAQAGSGDVVAVQYYRHRYRRGRRAGLYNCGPGGLNTHLARKACGYSSSAKRFLYRR